VETWYRKTLGDGAAASAPSLRIQQLFPPLFAAAGQPSSMAVFARHDRKADRVTAYFSPRAAELKRTARRPIIEHGDRRRRIGSAYINEIVGYGDIGRGTERQRKTARTHAIHRAGRVITERARHNAGCGRHGDRGRDPHHALLASGVRRILGLHG